jgi:hypothetical protein
MVKTRMTMGMTVVPPGRKVNENRLGARSHTAEPKKMVPPYAGSDSSRDL